MKFGKNLSTRHFVVKFPKRKVMGLKFGLKRIIKKIYILPTNTLVKYFLKQMNNDFCIYEGHLESKERFAIQRYLLIIGKKKNMQVL